jgi:type VI secretion system protein ImpI
VIGALDNNPLKYSAGPREATLALLRRREEGYLAPLPAVEAAFRDLKAHELALLDGMRAAVAALLGRFDPKSLEGDLADASNLALLLQGGRRARLWELYGERYAEIAEAARARFLGDLDRAFAEAYEKRTSERPVARAPGTGTGP